MSISFYPAVHETRTMGERPITGYFPMLSCDCLRRYLDACDTCDDALDYPDKVECESCDVTAEINLSNANARDLMSWLDLPRDDCGEMKASELAARCRRRLWPEDRNDDEGREGFVDASPGRATLIDCGRSPGYLRQRTEQLLRVCERAGEAFVVWA